jgi:hypothetical protein
MVIVPAALPGSTARAANSRRTEKAAMIRLLQ